MNISTFVIRKLHNELHNENSGRIKFLPEFSKLRKPLCKGGIGIKMQAEEVGGWQTDGSTPGTTGGMTAK